MAVGDLDLSVRQGEFVCVIGDVGSGKSSLLSAMIGDLLYANPQFMNEHASSRLNNILKRALTELS
jgi:ABC-type nitrate/sulfonate/bicarbonate transport system ATPase subunit